jgi:hypothetical protein
MLRAAARRAAVLALLLLLLLFQRRSRAGAPGRDAISAGGGAPARTPGFDLRLPLTAGPAPPAADAAWAAAFLGLPAWSAGFAPCDSPRSEVSCAETVRAARAVARWASGPRAGAVHARVGGVAFADRLSMLYHALQIAIATNRTVVTDRRAFLPIALPPTVRDARPGWSGRALATDFQFACADVSGRFPRLELSEASWPQVLYTHPQVAPFMRDHFGFHAAHFLGNYLFGGGPGQRCAVQEETVVEEWGPTEIERLNLNVEELVARCGVSPENAAVVSNTERTAQSSFRTVAKSGGDDGASVVCRLQRLMSGRRIVHTFGSRVGFWATAMLGVRGGCVDIVSRLCFNLTNSQQGSLYHSYLLPQDTWAYRTNSWFYVCGRNADDARLYVEYLLW